MKFKLFTCCIPVRGAKRSIICDLQRKKFHFIPNSLFDILVGYEILDFTILKQTYPGDDNWSILDGYQSFLLANEYIFEDDDLNAFPKLNFSFEIPFEVANAIIEIQQDQSLDTGELIAQLLELGVQHLELRITQLSSINFLKNILYTFGTSDFHSISIFLNNSLEISEQELLKTLVPYGRFKNAFLYNSQPFEPVYSLESETYIYSLELNSLSNLHCGKIDVTRFEINIKHFVESLHYNSCLNKKLSIDSNGDVRNCPSLPSVYGNIHTSSLKEILVKTEIRNLWSLTKDQIKICKDCEFRYICTDCRAFLLNPTDITSKPLKCGYDPYTNTSTNWVEIAKVNGTFSHYKFDSIEEYLQLDELTKF